MTTGLGYDVEAQPTPAKPRNASEIVSDLKARSAPRRDRVLRSVARLREIADSKSQKR